MFPNWRSRALSGEREARLPSTCRTDVVERRTSVEFVRAHNLSENVPYAYAAITPEVGAKLATARLNTQPALMRPLVTPSRHAVLWTLRHGT